MKRSFVLVTIAVALVLVISSAAMAAPPHGKVMVCHQTASAKNPSVMIEIAVNALPTHLAHGDEWVIDADGILTPGPGGLGDIEVKCGDPLTSWPTGFWVEGIDWFDNDWDGLSPRTWTVGDGLHVEGPAHPGAIRDGVHQVVDPTVVGVTPVGTQVSVDLEGNLDFGGGTGVDPRLKFFDTNGNGSWDDGEDIVLDVDGDGVFG